MHRRPRCTEGARRVWGECSVTDLVYVQTHDRTGRTILSVYNDADDCERGYVLAYAGPSHGVYVDPDTPPDVAEQVKRLSSNELVQDPWQDLSWLATHRVAFGVLGPIP